MVVQAGIAPLQHMMCLLLSRLTKNDSTLGELDFPLMDATPSGTVKGIHLPFAVQKLSDECIVQSLSLSTSSGSFHRRPIKADRVAFTHSSFESSSSLLAINNTLCFLRYITLCTSLTESQVP